MKIALADKADCTGCGACVASCVRGAVSMVEDADGFAFPKIDAAVCVACGRCRAACPSLNAPKPGPRQESPVFFAARLRSADELREVSSGGAFWALARTVLDEGGVVYGAVMEGAEAVRHIRATTIEEAGRMRRSKYLPSDAAECYAAAKRDLADGRKVLFTGTGCQVAGLLGFLGAHPEGLVTCDVVCHGVPSMGAWRAFCREEEARKGKRIAGVVFRDKSLGWRNTCYETIYEDGSVERVPAISHPYHLGYIKGYLWRESCGRCPYSALPRAADISLADFWKFNGRLGADGMGVSLVTVQSARGMELLRAADALLAVEEVSESLARASCRNLSCHSKENPRRRDFLDELRRGGYFAAARKFGIVKDPPGPVARVFGKARRTMRKMLKPFLPFRDKPQDAPRRRAMEDAFRLLSRKGVAVWFCNHVEMEKSPGWSYSDSAEWRIAHGLDFPTMHAAPQKYERDLREIFGGKWSPEYVRDAGKIPQIVGAGGVWRHEDCAGRLVNVVGGLRVTCGAPKAPSRRLHVYGRCGAFGYAVEDADTLPSRLQSEFNAAGVDAGVVNHGLWGGSDAMIEDNFLREVSGFRKGDVVVFYRSLPPPRLIDRWKSFGVRMLDITHRWHGFPEAKGCFFDRPGHMNAAGYANAAKLLAAEILETGFRPGRIALRRRGGEAAELSAYLKSAAGMSADAEIEKYVASLLADHPPLPPPAKTGAIVMNCNPFTAGHRYLVEKAAGEVDRLFIFVVEEDRSFFRFKDRLEMVERGVRDLPNTVVVPSGKFIISSLTFPEYFMKDYVQKKDFDVSSDVRTFAARIAPRLGITVRFAGEEPFDSVTANYNRCMADILPRSGIEFREIPRLALKGRGAVCATEVRRLLDKGDWAALAPMVPPSTLEIVRERYAGGPAS